MKIFKIDLPAKSPEKPKPSISIPDDDMVNWINTLRSGGDFSEEEIDDMMVYLNADYAKAKGGEVAKRLAKETEVYLRKKYGKNLSSEQKKYMIRAIESRFKKE